MVHQFNIFILLFGALQSVLLTIWFFRKDGPRVANTYFGLLLAVFGIQLVCKVISKTWLLEEVPLLYGISYRLPLLIGPLIYLYVKRRNDERFAITDLLHFVPFLVFFLLFFYPVYYLKELGDVEEASIQLGMLLAYGIAADRVDKHQLRMLIVVVTVVEIIVAIVLMFMRIYYGWFPALKLLFTLLTLIIYWISYLALARPDFFVNKTLLDPIRDIVRKAKYLHSSLRPDEAIRIEAELSRIMTEEKIYLDPDLTIDKLASKLATTRHHVSQVLNEKLGMTYSEYLTDFRLNEVRKRLMNPANHRYTVAAIANDSGFRSLSSFNEAFKKRFDATPSEFRNAAE